MVANQFFVFFSISSSFPKLENRITGQKAAESLVFIQLPLRAAAGLAASLQLTLNSLWWVLFYFPVL